MSAKRTILLIIAAFAALSAAAQARLVFEPDTWDFGTIRESDGRVSHTFTGVNRGDKPLVILDVVTSCGCTAPVTVQDRACTDKSYPRFWADLAALTAVPAAETTKPDEGA